MIKVKLPDGSERAALSGSPLGDLLSSDPEVLGAMVDHLVVGLDYRLVRSANVIPLRYADKEGNEIYRRTLSFILAAAAMKVFPGERVVIGHSLANGYYYEVDDRYTISDVDLNRLELRMRELINADIKLNKYFVSVEDAIKRFSDLGRKEKVNLLKRNYEHDISFYEIDGFIDIPFGPLAPSTSRVGKFELVTYQQGFVLRFPDKRDITRMPIASDQTRLFAVYHESKKWSQILGIQNVGDLNEVIAKKQFRECVQVAEALHEKKLASIADMITERIDKSRLIFIAGPSSSGKTTFAKRLGVHLRVNGIRPISIGMDDYFVNRDETPKDDKGEFDFESLKALKVELFNEHILRLLAGEEVTIPRFDFKLGIGFLDGAKIKLEKNQVLIVEGIHGLNPSLTPRIPLKNKFRIYISALTQLTIDDCNRIPTTDTRLIRRIVRDHQFRGYSACETLKRWPLVIRGEKRNIFPYQEEADVIFNTALLYELAVLKPCARRALEEVPPDQFQFSEAQRMLDFLHLFIEGDSRAVPPTSILREFIGGSSFSY